MSMRRADSADVDFPSRASHHVENPEGYEDWRTYAFSDAPELVDNDLSDAASAEANRTV